MIARQQRDLHNLKMIPWVAFVVRLLSPQHIVVLAWQQLGIMTQQESPLVLIITIAGSTQAFKDTPVHSDTRCIEKEHLLAMSHNHNPTPCLNRKLHFTTNLFRASVVFKKTKNSKKKLKIDFLLPNVYLAICRKQTHHKHINMQASQPCSFSIKYCKNGHLDAVSCAIKTWCSKNTDNRDTHIVMKRNQGTVDDDFHIIMYVNSIDLSHRHNAMHYIRTDLNKTFDMDMVCREQGGSTGVVFALLLITMEKPLAHEIRQQFKRYGDFDTVVKTDRSTFLNFQNYNDAKQALEGSRCGVPIANLIVRPIAIQHTKMLMQFEQVLLKDKDKYQEKNVMEIEYVKKFVTNYRQRVDFDMKWEKDDTMVESCSKLVVDLYGWVHHKDEQLFSSEKAVVYAKECEDLNTAINDSLKQSFINAVKKSILVVASVIENEADIADVFVEDDAKVVVSNDLDMAICENKKDGHVQQKVLNELNRLEIEFFGEVNTKETKIHARLVELEECLCLSKDAFDIQERIFHIGKCVKKLSKWLDCQETDVKF